MARIPLDALEGASLNVARIGEGPPALALHGFTGSISTWDSFVSGASGDYSIVAVDLQGHGASDAPDSPVLYDMAHTVEALDELLEQLHITRAHWLGYSMGGRIALAAAIMLPGRILSVTLESASPGLANSQERAARVRDDETLALRLEQDGIEAFVEHWESLPLWKSQRRLSTPVRDRLRTQRLSNSPAGLANSLRGIGTGAQPPLHDKLGELRAPVLLVAGREDTKFHTIAREMHQAIGGSRLSVVRHAGHCVHLEQPDRFESIVLGFFRSVDGAETNPTVRTGRRTSR